MICFIIDLVSLLVCITWSLQECRLWLWLGYHISLAGRGRKEEGSTKVGEGGGTCFSLEDYLCCSSVLRCGRMGKKPFISQMGLNPSGGLM